MKYPFKTTRARNKKISYLNLKKYVLLSMKIIGLKKNPIQNFIPNLEEAKSKVAKPYYWILNAIDKYEDEELRGQRASFN
jgi:hypothetical protein